VELRISSVAISTNRFGDFSRCSLITDRIGGDRLQHLGTMAQEICDKFTHQPQTGRFLVFCMILGELCQGLVCDYQSILDEFIRETLLDDKIVSFSFCPSPLAKKGKLPNILKFLLMLDGILVANLSQGGPTTARPQRER